MRDFRFPVKETQAEPVSADLCRRLLEKITSGDFYGECTIRVTGGRIYNVTMTQTFKAKDLNHLS